jgi:hypothetical protein
MQGIVLTAEQMQQRAKKLLEVAGDCLVGQPIRYDIQITGSPKNLCDPSIDINGVTIAAVEEEVPKIGGTITIQAFQLHTVEYIPAYRPPNGDPGDPPSEDLKEHGEPHRNFDDAMTEAIKLLVEYEIDQFRQSEGDDDSIR